METSRIEVEKLETSLTEKLEECYRSDTVALERLLNEETGLFYFNLYHITKKTYQNDSILVITLF